MRHLVARRAFVTGAAALAWSGAVKAQTSPPGRLIVPYPAGGTIDEIGRLMASAMKRVIQQELQVENLPGAAGSIGLMRLLASSWPDMGIGTDSDAILVPMVNREVKYRPEQFRSLGVLTETPLVLVTGESQRRAELREWLAAADARTPMSIGSYGVGSNSHLCAEDFAAQAGVHWTHVPYKGIAPLLQDLLGGHVGSAFLPLLGGVHDMVRAGRLRALGLASAQRQSRHPAIPTLAEAGGPPDVVHGTWAAAIVPDSWSAGETERAHAAVQSVLRDRSFRADLEARGTAAAAPSSLEDAQRHYAAQIALYARRVETLRAKGITFAT